MMDNVHLTIMSVSQRHDCFSLDRDSMYVGRFVDEMECRGWAERDEDEDRDEDRMECA